MASAKCWSSVSLWQKLTWISRRIDSFSKVGDNEDIFFVSLFGSLAYNIVLFWRWRMSTKVCLTRAKLINGIIMSTSPTWWSPMLITVYIWSYTCTYGHVNVPKYGICVYVYCRLWVVYTHTHTHTCVRTRAVCLGCLHWQSIVDVAGAK